MKLELKQMCLIYFHTRIELQPLDYKISIFVIFLVVKKSNMACVCVSVYANTIYRILINLNNYAVK